MSSQEPQDNVDVQIKPGAFYEYEYQVLYERNRSKTTNKRKANVHLPYYPPYPPYPPPPLLGGGELGGVDGGGLDAGGEEVGVDGVLVS